MLKDQMITPKLNLNHSTINNTQPKVSIIVPTYNRGNFIQEMIESVISQTYDNWELIIVDDGSTDNTAEIITPYISKKIHYYSLEHTGRSFARNFGISKSTGEFIAYLDSDDVFLPTKIEKQVKWLIEHSDDAMVYTSALQINDFGEYFPALYLAECSGDIYKKVAMFLPVTITLPSVLIRKEVQDKIGDFDEELDRFEDTDMWRRVSRDYKIHALMEPLLKVRTHQDNRLESLNPEKVFIDVQKYIHKVKKEDGKKYGSFVTKGSSRLYYHYGVAFAQITTWKKWRNRLFLASFKCHPFFFSSLLIISIFKRIRKFIMKE